MYVLDNQNGREMMIAYDMMKPVQFEDLIYEPTSDAH